MLVDVNGTPLFLPVDFDSFDANGRRVHFSLPVPPGLSGIVATFVSFGVAASGTVVASNPAMVTFL